MTTNQNDYGVSDVWGDLDDEATPAVENDTAGQLGGIPAVRSFDVCVFNSATDNVPTPSTMTISELRDWLKGHADRAAVDVMVTGDKDHDKPAKNAGAAFSPCRYRAGTTRAKANVEAVSCFVADLDDVNDDDMADVFARLEGLAFFAWTTWGSGWCKPQAWRVVVPFAVDVAAEDWPAVWLLLSERFAPKNDKATKDASRLSFLPRTPRMVPDGEGGQRVNDPVQWHEQDGALLDPTPFVVEARQRAAAARDEAEAARAAAEAARQTRLPSLSRSSTNRPDKVTRADAWARNAEIAIDGQGGSAVAMRVVGTAVRGFDLDEGEAMQALATWNGKCLDPWPPDQLRHKVRDALSTPDPQGRPRGWLLDQDRPQMLARDAAGLWGQNAANDNDEPERPWLIHADEFCRQPSAIPWLIKDWLQAEALMMVHGPSGSGKTFVVLDWCCRIASDDVDTWGAHKVHHGGVVYLAGEGHNGLRLRLAAWKAVHGVASLNMAVSNSGCDLNTPEGLAMAIAAIKAVNIRPSLVVVDTLHRFLAGDESSPIDVKTMLAACAKLQAAFGCSTLLVHHTGHANPERERGSTAWFAGCDIVVGLIPATTTNPTLIRQRKNKDGEVLGDVSMQLQPTTIPEWFDEDGAPVGSAVVDLIDVGGQRQARQLGGMEGRVLAAFDEATQTWLSLKEVFAAVKGRKADVIKACNGLIDSGHLAEGPRAPNAQRIFCKPEGISHSHPTGVGNGETLPDVSGLLGNEGNAGNATNDDDEARILAAFIVTGAPVAMAMAKLASMSRLPKGRAEAATDRLVAKGRLQMRAGRSGAVFKVPGTAGAHTHGKLLENAWAHSGCELHDGAPYISRDGFRAFLLHSQGVAASKVDAKLKPDGKPGEPVRDMLDAFAIAPHGDGWVVVDAAQAARMLLQKRLFDPEPA